MATSPLQSRPKPEGRKPPPNAGPPDLDELWRDLNRKLGGLFGKPSGGNSGGGNGGGYQPDMKSAGIGAGLIAAVVVVDLARYWLFHRARGPASRHHPVWQIPFDCQCGFQLAHAVPDSAP